MNCRIISKIMDRVGAEEGATDRGVMQNPQRRPPAVSYLNEKSTELTAELLVQHKAANTSGLWLPC